MNWNTLPKQIITTICINTSSISTITNLSSINKYWSKIIKSTNKCFSNSYYNTNTHTNTHALSHSNKSIVQYIPCVNYYDNTNIKFPFNLFNGANITILLLDINTINLHDLSVYFPQLHTLFPNLILFELLDEENNFFIKESNCISIIEYLNNSNMANNQASDYHYTLTSGSSAHAFIAGCVLSWLAILSYFINYIATCWYMIAMALN